MNASKKVLALLLTLAMICSLAMPALAADEETTPQDSITILYTNDVHTYISKDLTYSLVAAYRDTLDNVLLVDAGDHIQGTAYGGLDNGATIIELMNAAGYDLATLGNHEFDYGMEGCLNAIAWADFPYVSCNFYHEENGVVGENVLDSYKVFEVDGVKIAFIGITTPESFTKSTPAYFQDEDGNYIYGIAGGDDGAALYAAVQTAIDAASQEADYVIALGHLGDDPSSSPWTSNEVIANTTGLDAFIDGHSHSTVPMEEVADKDGNTVVLTQTGSYLDALGQMTIAADGTITTQLLTAEDLADLTPDAAVKAIEDAWITEVDEMLGEKIAASDIDFTVNFPDSEDRAVRMAETNLGDFNADAYYWYSNEVAGLDTDIAIMNGGGIRANADAGDWSYLTCKTINTFGNVLCVVKVTGQAVLDALEFGARYVDADNTMENGGFLQVAGLTYDINIAVENTVQTDDKSVWTGGPTEYRVTNVQVYNKETGEYEPLELDKIYTMAGTNYTLLNCGDGFDMFGEAEKVLDGTSEDYLALAAYAMAFTDSDGDGYADISSANSPLAAYEGYLLNYEEPTGAGRITVIDEAAASGLPADVPATAWYAPAVEFVLENGYMNGTNVGFEPKSTVTRGTVYQVLYNMAGKPEVTEAATFTDVEGKWYADAAAWAEDEGLTAGTGDGLFSGDRAMTRQELAKVFADYAAACGIEPEELADLTAFADAADVSEWAVEGMQISVALGILNGSDGKLNPKGTALRSELAQILMNFDALISAGAETEAPAEAA